MIPATKDDIERIEAKLDELMELLQGGHCAAQQRSTTTIPASFLPGGVDWCLMATEEERRAFNRKRGAELRKKTRQGKLAGKEATRLVNGK